MSTLRNAIVEWEIYQRASQEAAWLICNSLAYSTGGEEIEFLAGHIHSQETGEIEIAAFTKNFVIYSRGVPGPKGPDFSIVPRRALTRLGVHSAPEVISNSYMDHYVTGSYSVEYGESLTFTLPLKPRGYYAELDTFARALWMDLLN